MGQSFLTSRFARNEIDFFSPLNSKVTQLVNCTWKLPEPLKVGVPGGDGIKCEFLLWLWTKSQDAFRDIQKDVTRCHLPIRNLVFVQVNASGESIGAGPTRNKVKATGLRNGISLHYLCIQDSALPTRLHLNRSSQEDFFVQLVFKYSSTELDNVAGWPVPAPALNLPLPPAAGTFQAPKFDENSGPLNIKYNLG